MAPQKRLSGTYLERLIYFFLPLFFIVGIVLLFFAETTTAIKTFCFGMLFFWAIDSLGMLIRFRPKPLMVENGQIRYGDNYLAFSQIESIEFVSGRYLPLLWLFYTMIKIKLGTSEAVYTIPKSVSFRDLINGNFTPAAEALWSIPQLRDKLIIPDGIKRILRKKYAVEEIGELNEK